MAVTAQEKVSTKTKTSKPKTTAKKKTVTDKEYLANLDRIEAEETKIFIAQSQQLESLDFNQGLVGIRK